MGKRVIFALVLMVALIFFSGSGLASFSYKGSSIERQYNGGDILRGFVNITLANEPSNSAVSSSLGGSISLIKLLENNDFSEGIDYTCSKQNCKTDYSESSEAGSLSLSAGEPKTIGFKINGEFAEVTSLKFSITSNAAKLCGKQIEIDVLGKNESMILNTKQSSEACTGDITGCFDAGASAQMAEITTNPYCEKLSLPPAPAYKIGAVVKNGTIKSKLKMSMFDSYWNFMKECKLPSHTLETERLACLANYSSAKGGEFWVCISADKETDYKIKIESSGLKCGTAVLEQEPPYNKDFDIFANSMAFDNVGTIGINDSTFYLLNNNELAVYVNEYLAENYMQNCSNGCYIPFKISGTAQEISIGNPEVKYTLEGDPTKLTSSEMYILEKEAATISSIKPLNIDISKAGFALPLAANSSWLQLFINGGEVLPNKIKINITAGFDFDISPKEIFFGRETIFHASALAGIASSSWDFGDGTSKEVSGTDASHRYTAYSPAGYNIEVEMTRMDGLKRTKIFPIVFKSLSESLDSVIAEYESRAANISSQISAFPAFVQEEVQKTIDLDAINSAVSEANAGKANATTDEQYIALIGGLTAKEIPSSIGISKKASALPLLAGYDVMDISLIEQISGKESSDKEELKKQIANWVYENYEGGIDYEVVSKTSEGAKTAILIYVKISAVKKASSGFSGKVYLIINYPRESISFAGNYSEISAGSGVYIPIDGSKDIEFAISDEMQVEELGIYLSPEINAIGGAAISVEGAVGFRWGRFIFWMIVVIIAVFVAYIALQEWYKRRYEFHLFKNPHDLYNLINFVYNSRKAGMADGEIAKKLKNSGWSGEQITYATRKLDGKRTGMWEIPLFRFFEKKKVMSEIAKRQQAQPSAKQP
jgi:hypothetical protein